MTALSAPRSVLGYPKPRPKGGRATSLGPGAVQRSSCHVSVQLAAPVPLNEVRPRMMPSRVGERTMRTSCGLEWHVGY